jgi:hypothetical protein
MMLAAVRSTDPDATAVLVGIKRGCKVDATTALLNNA